MIEKEIRERAEYTTVQPLPEGINAIYIILKAEDTNKQFLVDCCTGVTWEEKTI